MRLAAAAVLPTAAVVHTMNPRRPYNPKCVPGGVAMTTTHTVHSRQSRRSEPWRQAGSASSGEPTQAAMHG